MATPLEPRKNEQPSTYFVQDRENKTELDRLAIQDRMITNAMGGVLPEQPDPTVFRHVLDIACGSGGWVIEAARAYPTMSLIGIDISQRMMDYAREQAEAQHVADRVEFRVMDALRVLEFPDRYFDLVNMRLGISFLRTWDWPKLLSEMLRVTRSGGIIRITEPEVVHQSNSAAIMRIHEIMQNAFFQAGHLFAPETTGVTGHLPGLLKHHGCQHVQEKTYALVYRAGTPEGQAYYEDMAHGARTLVPFLQKWGSIPQDMEAIGRQAFEEIQQPGYYAKWIFHCVWGTRR